MTKVVVITHGRLGEALLETASMISGHVQGVSALSFLPEQSVEELRTAIREELSGAAGAGTLCLVDIPGGSPARTAAELSLEHDDVEVVTGVNLPMLLEVLFQRDTLGVKELARLAVQVGHEGIFDLSERLRASLNDGG